MDFFQSKFVFLSEMSGIIVGYNVNPLSETHRGEGAERAYLGLGSGIETHPTPSSPRLVQFYHVRTNRFILEYPSEARFCYEYRIQAGVHDRPSPGY